MTLVLFFISLLMNFVVTVSIGDIRSAWCYGTKLLWVVLIYTWHVAKSTLLS